MGIWKVAISGGRSIWLPIAVVLFGVVISTLDSFSVDQLSDQRTARVLGALAGPVYGGSERIGQDEIVIVAFNASSLRDFRNEAWTVPYAGEWPLPYEIQASVAEAVAGLGAKAVFLDLYYSSARGGEEAVSEFARRLRRVARTSEVVLGPVATDDPDLAPLTEFSQAGLAFPLDMPDGVYPLRDPDGRPRAALALFDIWCRDRPETPVCAAPIDPDGADLSLTWGFGTTPAMAALQPAQEREDCEARDLEDRVGAFWRIFWRNALRAVSDRDGLYFACPYHDTISASWLLDPSRAQDFRDLVEGRIVLIGADLPWIADSVDTPLFGSEPGVSTHAMALDNFMESGAAVRRVPERLFLEFDVADAIEAGAIIFALCLGAGFAAIRAHHPWWPIGGGVAATCAVLAVAALAYWGLRLPPLNVAAVLLAAGLAAWAGSGAVRAQRSTEQATDEKLKLMK